MNDSVILMRYLINYPPSKSWHLGVHAIFSTSSTTLLPGNDAREHPALIIFATCLTGVDGHRSSLSLASVTTWPISAEHIARDKVFKVRLLTQRLLRNGYLNLVQSLFTAPACNHHDVSWPQQRFIFVLFTQRQADWSDVISKNSVAAEFNQGNIWVIVVFFGGELVMQYNLASTNYLCWFEFWMFDLVNIQFTKTDFDISRWHYNTKPNSAKNFNLHSRTFILKLPNHIIITAYNSRKKLHSKIQDHFLHLVGTDLGYFQFNARACLAYYIICYICFARTQDYVRLCKSLGDIPL